MRSQLFAVLFVILSMGSLCGVAGEKSPDPKAKTTSIPVAILDFEATAPGNPELGKQIAETMVAMLTGEGGFTLVDRTAMGKTLQEHELNLTGLVDSNQAVKISKLVGARIIVTGKAFVLGEQLMITAKIIGTETSLVEGVLVKGKRTADVGELVMQLGEKLTERLREKGPKLVVGETELDPVPALKEKLAKLKLPKMAVIVKEQHITHAQQPIDPAVETEIKSLLRSCGVELQDIKGNELAEWAKKGGTDPWPQSLEGVDLVVVGEAFSELGARLGNLQCCAARAEINLISRKDGKIAVADRTITRAVDLAENIAGKKALEKAGRVLGIAVLEYLAKDSPRSK
jgi:hypothetical protein